MSIYLIIIILVLIFNYFIKNNYINLIINIILHSVLFIVIIFLYNIIKFLFPRIKSTTEILHKIPKFLIIFLFIYLICFISILLYNSQGKITFILSMIYLLIFSFYYLNNTNNENKLTRMINKIIFSLVIIYFTINFIWGKYLDISIFKDISKIIIYYVIPIISVILIFLIWIFLPTNLYKSNIFTKNNDIFNNLNQNYQTAYTKEKKQNEL